MMDETGRRGHGLIPNLDLGLGKPRQQIVYLCVCCVCLLSLWDDMLGFDCDLLLDGMYSMYLLCNYTYSVQFS